MDVNMVREGGSWSKGWGVRRRERGAETTLSVAAGAGGAVRLTDPLPLTHRLGPNRTAGAAHLPGGAEAAGRPEQRRAVHRGQVPRHPLQARAGGAGRSVGILCLCGCVGVLLGWLGRWVGICVYVRVYVLCMYVFVTPLNPLNSSIHPPPSSTPLFPFPPLFLGERDLRQAVRPHPRGCVLS